MLQNIDVSIKEVVKNIKDGKYTIPKFQRKFVWKIADIESLGDSLIRGYPISSMLTMPESGSLDIASDPLSTAKAPEKSVVESNYLLDGQQRITSLAKIFLNYDDKFEYYFDMLSILNEKYPEDNILNFNFFGDLIKINNGKRKQRGVSENFCVSYKANKNGDNLNSKGYSRFISGVSIIKQEYSSIIFSFLTSFFSEENELNYEHNQSLFNKYNNFLNATFGSLSNYSIPMTNISGDSDLGVVCRVFEKVNSTGKKLTVFDLINAKSFKSEKFSSGFADYLEETISNNIAINPRHQNYINYFFEFDTNTGSFTNLARITRIIAIYDLLNTGHTPSITNSGMLSKDADFWFQTWDEIGGDIIKFIVWLGDNNLLQKICPMSFYEYICAILLNNNISYDKSTFMNMIKKYALFLGVSNRTFSKTDLDVVLEFDYLAHQFSLDYGFDKIKESPNTLVSISKDDVLKNKYTSNIANAIFYIMYNENSEGKFTFDLLGTKITDYKSLDKHHIHPKAYGKNRKEYDSIANIVIIPQDLNRDIIKDSPFSEYFIKIKSKCDNNFDYICDSLLFPDNPMLLEDIDFIEKRAEYISKYVNNYFS